MCTRLERAERALLEPRRSQGCSESQQVSVRGSRELREHDWNRGVAKCTASVSEFEMRGSRELKEHYWNRGVAKGTASVNEFKYEARER